MVMFPPKIVWCAKLYHTADTCSKHLHAWQTRGDVLEPIVVTCNIEYVQHLVGEEQIRFICATRSEGRSARSTAVYTIHDMVPLPVSLGNSWSFSCGFGSNAMQT